MQHDEYFKFKADWSRQRLVEVTAAMHCMDSGRHCDAYNILRNMATRLAWDAGAVDRVNELNLAGNQRYGIDKSKSV